MLLAINVEIPPAHANANAEFTSSSVIHAMVSWRELQNWRGAVSGMRTMAWEKAARRRPAQARSALVFRELVGWRKCRQRLHNLFGQPCEVKGPNLRTVVPAEATHETLREVDLRRLISVSPYAVRSSPPCSNSTIGRPISQYVAVIDELTLRATAARIDSNVRNLTMQPRVDSRGDVTLRHGVFTTCSKALPAVSLNVLSPRIWISAPVDGLRPMRTAPCPVENDPKPIS
jgi:hypothetical protein